MGEIIMFQKSACWYDALYGFKDYSSESADIISVLKKIHPEASTLLDIACGSGEHHRYLSGIYSVDGVDLNSDFLEYAAKKNPDGEYFQCDMIDFQLSKTYDVILCLFSSIGYAGTVKKLVEALKSFRKHLNPNGVVLVEPWFTPDRWKPDGRVHMLTAETEDGSICRMSGTDTKKSQSIVNFHYLAGTATGVEYFTETHVLGLFTINQMKKAFKSAGLDCTFDEEGLTGRGLYIGSMKG